MTYARARYYQPEIGRFISEDTYRGTLGNPLSQNLYAYVGNNPLIYVDPSGHAGRLFDFRGGSGGARNFGGGVERGGGVGSIRGTNITTKLSSGPYKVSSPSKVVVENSLNNFPIKATPNKSYFTPKYLKVGKVANKGTGNGADNIAQYEKLKTHLRQAEKYGKAEIKELPDGRIRYYGEVTPATKPGEMVELESGIQKQALKERGMRL